MSASVEPLLSRIRSRTRVALLRGLVAGGAAGMCVIVLLSAAAVGLGLADAGVALLQLVLGLSLVAAGVVAWRRSQRRFGQDLDDTAARVDAVLGSTLRDAFELERDRARFGASQALTAAAVQRSLDAAERDGVEARWEAHRVRLEKRAWLGLAGALGLLALCAGLSPRVVGQGASAWLSVQSFEDPFETVPPEPRLGNYRITYRFPDYAGRPPQTIRSADGSLQALPGTEVEIETEAAENLQQAALVLRLQGDEGELEQKVAAQVDGPRLRASFVLRRPGQYRITTLASDGTAYEERRGHPIRIDLDEPPVVRLLRPEASPLEVDAKDQLDLEYTAKDDYGLAEAFLRWRVLGSERSGRIPLATFTDRKRARSTTTIQLTDLALQPGDRVAYSVEVADADRINGPKYGGSRTQELRVYSQRDHHRRVLAAQMEALDELVQLLGDHLEKPFAISSFESSLQAAEQKLERAATARGLLTAAETASREDPLGRPQLAEAFARTREGLGEQRQRSARAVRLARRSSKPAIGERVQNVEADMTSFLEKNAVYLADLLDDQRMIDAESLAKALREEQQALKDLLEQYKNAPDEETKAAIRASIQSMKKRISEMMQELAGLQSSIPNDYVNRDALNQDWQKMDQLSRMLEEGRVEDAVAQVDQMLQQSERMLAQLQEGRQTLGSREYSEIGQRAEEIWQDLEDVTMRQEELSRRTEEIARDARARLDAKVDATDGFIERQMARLERATEALQGGRSAAPLPDADGFEAGLQRLQDARTALEAKDFGAAKDVLEQGMAELDRLERESARRMEQVQRFGELFQGLEDLEAVEASLEQARGPTERVLEALEALTPSPDSVLSGEERRRLQAMQAEQAQLGERVQRLGEQLEELGEQLPIVGEEVGQTVNEVQEAMGEAQSRLGQADAPGGLNQERRALEGLRGLKGQLQQMGQSGGQGGGGGVPLPFGGGQPSGGEGGSGQQMQSRERVEIPQPEAFEAPTEFREELLEAAKKGTVEAYRDAVRRYYEELVQ